MSFFSLGQMSPLSFIFHKLNWFIYQILLLFIFILKKDSYFIWIGLFIWHSETRPVLDLSAPLDLLRQICLISIYVFALYCLRVPVGQSIIHLHLVALFTALYFWFFFLSYSKLTESNFKVGQCMFSEILTTRKFGSSLVFIMTGQLLCHYNIN